MHLEELFRKIDNFYIVATTVYGPYTKKEDGRQFVIIKKDDGSTRTVSYPKFLVEQKLGKELDINSTIDHIDFDFNNNNFDNLRVLPRAEHSKQDTRRVKLVSFDCPECGKKFERSPRLLRDKAKKGRSGPFCDRVCAGKNSRKVQLGLIEKLPAQPFLQSQYFRQKNVQAFLDFLETKLQIPAQ